MWRLRPVLVGVLACSLLLPRSAGAEPVDLPLETLDQFTAGAFETSPRLPNWYGDNRAAFERHTIVTTSFTMPIAQSLAICFMCSGDAMAVAIAGAFGNAHANATAITMGLGQTLSRARAEGPSTFLFGMPDRRAPGAER